MKGRDVRSIGTAGGCSNKYFGNLQFSYILDTNAWKPRFYWLKQLLNNPAHSN
ncbi:hypothetical protein C4K30_2947 [Pseudomonas chlororaphis subsp. piscium]|nr:hypothetical protein C4K30_2947 [Pseudomonas chlororaphis subsp. piscium]